MQNTLTSEKTLVKEPQAMVMIKEFPTAMRQNSGVMPMFSTAVTQDCKYLALSHLGVC